MHPNRKFRIAGRAEMAEIVRGEGFGTIIVETGAGLRAVHVPLLIDGERLLFHVSRSNAVHGALAERADALVVVNGPHAYVSPDWYGLPDRVPTWNYVAVEMNGPVTPLGEGELVRLLDAMSDEHEAKLLPKPIWKRDEMTAVRFEGLLKSIGGFALDIREWRGTAKIDQDKPSDVRNRIAAALRDRGEGAMAALMGAQSSPEFRGAEKE